MSEGYDELYLILRNLKDAAITAQFNVMHYTGDVHHGFEGWGITISPIWNTDKDGPDATITGPEGQVASFVPYGDYPFHSVESIVRYFSDGIDAAFQKWFELPDPRHFDDPVASARTAGATLALGAVDDIGDGPGAVRFGGNVTLSKHIVAIQDSAANSSGIAIRRFGVNYADALPTVTSGQDACACALWVGTAGEQRVWDRARTSVAEIAHQGVRAMQLAKGGSTDTLAILSVAGAFASVASLLSGGSAEAALGPVLGVLGQVLPSDRPESVPLGASRPVEVLTNIQRAMDRLNDQITREEQALADGFDAVGGHLDRKPESFDISSPALLNNDNPEDFRAARETRLDYKSLKDVANLYLPAVSAQFRLAAYSLVEADRPNLWDRNSGIGMGPDGPYPEWRTLWRRLVGLTSNTARELREVGEALRVVVHNFQATDARLQHELAAQTRRIGA